jgi:hypothetical protein
MLAYVVGATRDSSRTLSATNAFALMRAPRLAAIGLIALTASAHAVEQNALNPHASTDNALAITAPDVTLAIVPIDTAPIEAPPLPRPRPSLRDTVADGAGRLRISHMVMLISLVP